MAADISSEKINWNTASMQYHNCNTEKKEVNLEFYTEWKYASIIKMK